MIRAPDLIQHQGRYYIYDGPKSCTLYKAGPTRRVPRRKGAAWEEHGWVDEEAAAQRGEEEQV